MKLFDCQSCGQTLHFENRHCERCGATLGYLPEDTLLAPLSPAGEHWQPHAGGERRFRFCANAEFDACNWLLPANGDATHCRCCRHNRTIPDLADPAHRQRWQKLEIARHRLFYALLRFGLPLPDRTEEPEAGLAFDTLADPTDPAAPRVLTGHRNGLITLNIAEADDAERERRRTEMGEPYRTLLGHFRHEIGHFYWQRLVAADPAGLEACRAAFGDERADYAAALAAHYEAGAPAGWQATHVSAYATAHPWEDFAETWAHYFHLVDTLETAHAFGLRTRPRVADAAPLATEVSFDPYAAPSMAALIDAWLPLTVALNSLNRSMGQPDLYPFVLSGTAIAKLGFIHDLIARQRRT
jgi:hypothetical protein